jgi:hypothetical protein
MEGEYEEMNFPMGQMFVEKTQLRIPIPIHHNLDNEAVHGCWEYAIRC